MTHLHTIDHRISIVKKLIEPFQIQLNEILKSVTEIGADSWDTFHADDSEHIVGTAFIVFQNYINSSISDLYPHLVKLHDKYSIGPTINGTTSTKIKLIISIANYYKHRDLPTRLHKYTTEIFDDLHISYMNYLDTATTRYFYEIGSNSPVFTGFTMLSPKWNFNDILNTLSIWRAQLYNEYIENRE